MEHQPKKTDYPVMAPLSSPLNLCIEPKSKIEHNILTLTGQLPYNDNNRIIRGPFNLHGEQSSYVTQMAAVACAQMLLRNAHRAAKKEKLSIVACKLVWWKLNTQKTIPNLPAYIQDGVDVINRAFSGYIFNYCVEEINSLPENAILQVGASFEVAPKNRTTTV